MVMISNYNLERVGDMIFVRSKEKPVCPICFSQMKAIGSKRRNGILQDGVKQTFVIRRLKCEKCEPTHHELPDIFVPFKHYCVDTIEAIAVNGDKSVTPSPSTISRIKRWWQSIEMYFALIVVSLFVKYEVEFPATPSQKQVIRALVNSLSWRHKRHLTMASP